MNLGNILRADALVSIRSLCSSAEMGPIITLPVLFSTHIAFFLGSIQRGPANTALMVEGGVWRRPGPSFRAFDALEGIGRSSVGIISPGITNPVGIPFPLFSRLTAVTSS